MIYPSEVKGFNGECDLCIGMEISFQNTSNRRTHGLIIGNLKRHCESKKHRKRKEIKHYAWCDECKKRRDVTEVYYDKAKIVVTLICGHEYYVGTGRNY